MGIETVIIVVGIIVIVTVLGLKGRSRGPGRRER
jgi:hypothetical protein